MAAINGYDSNSISSLFSSLGTGNTNTSVSNGLYGVNLSDYASIKNGSYGKLMKSYYALDEEKNVKDTKSKNDTDDSDATIRNIKNTSAQLKDSAAALYTSKSLFEQDANGNYDMEAIYEKVNAFVEDYNSMIGSVGNAETDSIAKAGANLINAANNQIDMLSKIGISVNGSDFTLSINKEKFMAAKGTDVKSLFSGVGSFAYQVGAKASRIYTMVEDKVSSGTYKTASADNSSSSTSKDNANTIAKLKEKADDLVSTGTDLYKNRNLFRKDYNGGYDEDKIVEEIGAFVKDYNDLVIASEKTKSTGIANAMKTLEGITDAYSKELKKIGITQDKDGTLSLDEAVFRKADKQDAQSLFTGSGSFAYHITAKASMVANQAETEASKANTYTDSAKFSDNHNTGTIFNGIV